VARSEEAEVQHYPRKYFLEAVWDYHPGDAVTILAPQGGGKTHLGNQLLDVTATPELPVIDMVMKPQDETTLKFAKKLKLRIVRDWPPPAQRVRGLVDKPRGWVLWPYHAYDPRIDDRRHHEIFRRAILDSYKRGDRILFADETYSLEEELKLSDELRTVWTKGRSMRCGLWAASQRAAYISQWAYQAQHLFMGKPGDVDAERRLSDIGGAVNAGHVRYALSKLRHRQFLYINRDEQTMCVVEP
jgi:hypothetical protein